MRIGDKLRPTQAPREISPQNEPLIENLISWGCKHSDRLARARRKIRTQRAWKEFNLLWRNPPPPAVLVGESSSTAVPIIMCLWKRPTRISHILQMLDSQVSKYQIRLLLWNNNRRHKIYYEKAIQDFSPSGSLANIEIIHSDLNIGGAARFIYARHLVNTGYRGGFIMLDDDQDIEPDFLDTMIEDYRPKSIVGFWAWKVSRDNYWDREQALEGEKADYVGTGGCICDSAIAQNDNFFNQLPLDAVFIEDIWMSHFASTQGWALFRSRVNDITFVEPEVNQVRSLLAHKAAYWRRLPLIENRAPDTPRSDLA